MFKYNILLIIIYPLIYYKKNRRKMLVENYNFIQVEGK